MIAQSALQAAYFDDIDYTKLKSRLGAATPTGAGGSISIVEVRGPANDSTGSYLVDVSLPEFNGTTDPTGAGVNLTDGSFVAHTGFGAHATNVVAPFYFGNTQSVAPGANDVTNYEANQWLSSVLLSSGNAPPTPQNFRVQNHSWVGLGTGSTERSILRRADYIVETNDMTMVVGANNNPNPAVLQAQPTLLVYAYNTIVAGRSDGAHSRGQTNGVVGGSTYGSGRFRPDIVTPSSVTSTSTGRISSAATMMHEVVAGSDGARSEVIKAMLMAGATKGEFSNCVDPTTSVVNPWNRTQTRPLDDVFGAGELNVYNNYLIGTAGKHAASTAQPTAAVGSYGWDYQDRKADSAVGDLYYNFEVASGSTASDVSILLAWNAKITDTNADPNVFVPTEPVVQNLNLQLYDSTTSFMGSLVDQSISTVDNVEHIYLNSLAAGTYTLKVSGAANWDYGLAWRMTTSFDEPNADFDGDGLVSGSDFLIWQQSYGTLLGAANSEGDADGDGDVDEDDLTLFKAGVMASPIPPAVASLVAAVPEPSAMAMLGVGAAWLVGRCYRRRIQGKA
ncbi:MAG: PEP-CTERM sorting domain-containing protein [Planctomycetaceae bacterium]|nr:PEP-CTERM sorting domain-containing protein [Planctomycetaceae bacterium]